MIEQMLKRYKNIPQEEINKRIKDSHNRVISFSRNNIGLIDVDREIGKGTLVYCDNEFIDSATGLVYRFKANRKSGGPTEGRKELYESLISRLVAQFGKTVEYFPAEFDGDRGVFFLDWANEGHDFLTLNTITEAQTLKKLESDEKLLKKCSTPSLKAIKKLPQHFMVGNCDFLPRNIAFRYKGNKIIDILYFDYGYSSFSRVESSLIRRSLDINTKNIIQSYKDNIWGYTNSIVGMGPNYNLYDYCYLETIMKDFEDYSKYSKEFKKNVRQSISIGENFDEEIRKMQDEGFTIYPDNKNLILQINDINLENFSKIK